jgi:hypothetical protein
VGRIVYAFLANLAIIASFLTLSPAKSEDRANLKMATLTNTSFFSQAWIEESTTYKSLSDGDLWPTCWSGDDHVYAANGDGRGFNFWSLPYFDIVVNRISGTFPHLTGQALAAGDAVGQIWNANGQYNRKPTSMLCIDNTLYLAIQDLNLDFNDAPSASISRSTDYGATWTWDPVPMFDQYQFTTVMFLDYGKDSVHAIDQYVYVYGLDYNWRESVNHRVPDPMDLYLARVPKTNVQTRSAWEFYSGLDGALHPTWSPDISQRVSVLHFDRTSYLQAAPFPFDNLPALTQGGVVYNPGLNRYIYSAWTQYTFEFYEAPQPWGPWTRFLTESFGRYPWSHRQHGGYATTIPSKFISADGKQMWVQSNVCPCGNAGMSDYQFSLRQLYVEPNVPAVNSSAPNSA